MNLILNFLITMAVPTSNWSGQWYDFSSLRPHIDFFNAMTYDIHGSWSSNEAIILLYISLRLEIQMDPLRLELIILQIAEASLMAN